MVTIVDGKTGANITELDHKPAVLPSKKLVMLTDVLMGTEGNMSGGVKRESSLSPARSETPSTHRSLMHGTWEIPPQSSAERLDLSGKASGNEPDGNRGGKSDEGVLPKKQPNAAQAAEAVEVRISRKEGHRFTASRSMVSRHAGPLLVKQDLLNFPSRTIIRQ